MNSQIEAWRVQQYGANVYHLSQQEGSILEPLCRQESFLGKAEFFDRLGLATATDKVGRNGDTPNLDIDHSRRMVTTVTREWGTLVDRKDKLQNIHSPASEYAKAAAMGLGRRKDQVLIAAAFGNAASGEDGSSTVGLGNAQKVAAVASSALTYPNLQMLRKTKRIMDAGKVKGKRYIVHSADFLEALLSDNTITSADFNAVKALVNGELNTFMGFEFKHCEEIDSVLATTYDSATFKWSATTGLYDAAGTAIAATDKTALAFAEGAILRGETQNSFIARIEERADKSYSQQVYTAIDMGGVRMEEAKVVQMIYKA
jgi:hypothetical protein